MVVGHFCVKHIETHPLCYWAVSHTHTLTHTHAHTRNHSRTHTSVYTRSYTHEHKWAHKSAHLEHQVTTNRSVIRDFDDNKIV